jgi:hypothetical protein
MPLPSPRKGERKEDFIPRCHSAIAKIHPDWDRSKRHAVCESQFEHKDNSSFIRHLEITNSGSWKELKDYLLIEDAELLAPGTWTGADGIPTDYSPEVIMSANETILGKPIKITHEDKSHTVVGFWDAVKTDEPRTRVQGMVWHPDGIKYFTEHPGAPLSIEADAKCAFDKDTGTDVALSMTYTGGAAVDIPACPSSGVDQQRVIHLSGRRIEGRINVRKEKEMSTEDKWKLPEVTDERKKALETPFFAEEKLTTKVSDVIEHVKKSLSGVPEEQAEYVVKTLEANLGGEFAIDLPAPPPAGSTPPPPPAPPAGDDEKVTAMEEQITKLKEELTDARNKIDEREEADIARLGETIKAFDPEFDSNKFLSGVTDKSIQKKILEAHLTGVKRINPQPIKVKLSAEVAKKKVNAVSKELFGMNMEDLFKQMGLEVKARE